MEFKKNEVDSDGTLFVINNQNRWLSIITASKQVVIQLPF